MDFAELVHLEPHGADVLVGTGPSYPWGGLYGGQIVTQALRAAAATVGDGFVVHSLRAYFIRTGDAAEPVRYEVDRIRNGRSFCTRRVVARQAIGAILNLEASFHGPEGGQAIQTVHPTTDIGPDDAKPDDSWTGLFERRYVPGTDERGLVRCWFRMKAPLADDPLLHTLALAYISDDLPTDSVGRALGLEMYEDDNGWFSVSLDHTMWFHRPVRANEWHLQELTCHAFGDGRGLAIGHAFDADGTHLATIAQEVLLRRRR
jgi:acyl-CoA thioesterase-2